VRAASWAVVWLGCTVVGAGEGVGGSHYGQEQRGGLSRFEGSDEVESGRRGYGVDGVFEPEDERDEIVQFTEPKKGTYKKLIVRDGRLMGGILLGTSARRLILCRRSTVGRRCRKSG